jgi:large subunit ribosomal protein L22
MMQFTAKTRYTSYSPYKLRPLVDVVRGKPVDYALHWLATAALKRAVPIKKMIESAAANAKQLQNLEKANLVIKEIRVDNGPSIRYFKPGAMGRANVQKRRFSHLSVILEPKGKKKEVSSGSKS